MRKSFFTVGKNANSNIIFFDLTRFLQKFINVRSNRINTLYKSKKWQTIFANTFVKEISASNNEIRKGVDGLWKRVGTDN